MSQAQPEPIMLPGNFPDVKKRGEDGAVKASTQEPGEFEISRLQVVYDELSRRIAQDNANSSNMVSLTAVILTLLVGLLTQTDRLAVPTQVFAVASGTFLLLAMLAGLLSLLIDPNLQWLPLKSFWLREKGFQAYQQIQSLFDGAPPSLFHPRELLRRGLDANARLSYRAEIQNRLQDDLTVYVFFLARSLEVKRAFRHWSFLFIALGGVATMSVLVSHLLASATRITP
jgi:hypothetical protein